MVYGMSWLAWHGIWYWVLGMAWYALRSAEAWHGIWYVLADIAWYIVWPAGHGMVYGMT